VTKIPSTVEIRFEIVTKQKGELLGRFWETPMNTRKAIGCPCWRVVLTLRI
jgi:hypothetical protein